ncbi:hypothetical protein FBZ98_101544 [Rhizobium sp. ERR 922]|uniref:hypothetical protein n=1 Tax=Rhizobium TaxID=379 RepID=UPI0011ADDAEC|nr:MULTISPECIES: hypothetical protein [Rhizobium]TWB61209.1 hypothetical protein FBZ98_101544 [Rhizobium sp. ERR 922]TWC04135.1 hypothetical protein FBZ97_101544 [Rhizobium sp. ERR 942]GES46553.1 hypothetical protein RsS62_58050 [Rhizobium dioscoreae]
MDEFKNIVLTAKAIHAELSEETKPPEEGLLAKTQSVINISLVRGTRGYIERIANQVNGAYENGWYDAAAVMLRRLMETLIIEVFEKYSIADRIKNPAGDFFFLRDLITSTLNETAWNLSRNTKQALPKLKDVGDKSAHSRRYLAHRTDLDQLLPDIRMVVQELLFLAGLK